MKKKQLEKKGKKKLKIASHAIIYLLLEEMKKKEMILKLNIILRIQKKLS